MRNGVSLRKNRLGNFFKHNFNAQSKRAAILAAATAWIAPLKRSPILAAVQAALSTPSRRSAVMIAAAATAMVVASASNITPVRGDVTQNYIGPNGGYWGTASYWSNNVVPNNTGTTYIVDTSTGTSGDSGYTVDLRGGSFTIGGIFGNGSYISAITNTEGVGELIIDPSTLTSPIGSVINSTIESGTAGNPFVLQIGDNNGSDTSIVTELNPTTGTIGGGTAATDNVKIVLDGVEGNADFVQNNHYSGGTVIENGATAIAEVAGSFGTGQITFQTNGGTIKLGTTGLTINNNIALDANGTIDSAGFQGTFAGTISNPILQSFGLTIANSGGSGSYIKLTGPNTYTGGTTIDDNAALIVTGQIVGAVNLIGVSAGSTFGVLHNLSITDLNGGSEAYVALGQSGGPPGNYILSLRPTTNDNFAGTITEGSSAPTGATINFNGNSGTTFTLTGSISDVGFVNINSATVVVGSGGNMNANDGSTGEAITIGTSGGTLTVNAGGSVGGNLVDNGIFNVNTNDTLGNLSGGVSGQIVIGSGDTLTVTPSQADTFAGVISGPGANLTVAGGGATSLTLSGNNTYGDATTINAGATLIVTGSITGALTDNGTFDANNTFGITDLTGSGAINIASTKTLTVAPTGTNSDTYSGTIGSAGNLTVNGASGATLVLTGADSATGITMISGGTLDVNTGGSLTGNVTINSAGTLTVSNSGGGTAGDVSGNITNYGTFNVQANDTIGDLHGTSSAAKIIIGSGVTLTVDTTSATDSFAGVISGPGGNLEVSGTGVLTLSGANTYGDATTIDAGATLTTTGTIVGAMTDNGTWNIQNSLPGITDLTGSGAINVLAGNTLTVAPTVDDTFSGNITGANASLTVNGASGTSLTLSGTYSLGGTTTIGATGTLILTGNDSIGSVQFNAGAGTFQAQGNESITDLNGTNSSAQVIGSSGKTLTIAPTGSDSFAGEINGAGAVTLGGLAGTKLTLSGINSYSGGTTINANATLTVTGVIVDAVVDNGTWNVQNNLGITDLTGTNAAAAINILSGDTLTVNATGSDTFAGKITGSGGALDLASDSLTLSGKVTYTGLTTVENGATLTLSGTGDIIGAVQVNTGGTFAIMPNVSITDLNGGGSVTIATGDTLTSTPTTTDTFTGTIMGLGAFTLAGGAGTSLTLGGANTYSGGTTINSGATLIISNTGSIVGPMTDNGTWTINNSLPGITDLKGSGSIGIGNGDTLTVAPTASDSFSGSISGGGGLTVDGAGGTSLMLSGLLSYTGTTTLGAAGTLILSNSETLGAVQFGAGAGALQLQNNVSITDLNGSDTSASISIVSTKLLTVNPTAADDYEGAISGAGGLTVNGGTLGDSLTLSGALSYTGITTIGNTTTLILTDGSDSIGGVQFGAGAGSLQVQGNLSITDLNGSNTSASIVVNTGDVLTVSPTMVDDFEGSLTGGGGFTLTEGVLTLSGNYALTGPLTVDPGATLNLFGTGGQTVYNLMGGGNITIPTGDVLTDYQNTSTTFSGNISGGGGFDIYGNPIGTLTLSGTLTYTGETIVGSGATMILTGTGDKIGGLDVESGGTFEITPDTTIGDLTGGGAVIIGFETLTSVGTSPSTFSGTMSDNGTFAFQGASSLDISGPISGTGAVVIGTGSDTPTLELDGANTYSGGTIIKSGATLTVTGSIVDAVVDGGTFNVQNNLSITDLSGTGALNISENLMGTGYTLTVTPTAADKLLGPVSDNGSLAIDGTNSLELRGNVTGTGTTGSIVVGTGTDSPTLILDGTDTYSGGTTINYGATLVISPTGTIVGPMTDNGTWDIENNLPGITDLNGGTGASIIIVSGKTLTVAPANTLVADTFSGVISDTGGTQGALVVNGPGSLLLTNINTYTGGTTLGTGATLIIGTGGSIIGAMTDNGQWEVENNLSGITDLKGSGAVIITSGDTLTVSPNNGNHDTFFGIISDTGGTSGGTLVIGGNPGSSLTLSGNNLYTGGTTINAGATLNMGSTGSIIGAVIDNGTFGVGNSFTITDLTGTVAASKVILGAGDTLTVTPTMNDTYVGTVSGSGALEIGTSTPVGTSGTSLTLSGKNTYTGGTTIDSDGTFIVTGSIGGAVDNEGTFEVNNSFGITDLTGSSTSAAIILGAGDILTINATHGTTADVYMGSVSGSGGLTLATGTMDFALTNGLTYTGTTTIDAGATMDINGQIVGPVINNGILNDQTSHTIGNLSGTGSIDLLALSGAPQFLTVIETGATTFTGPISGPGGFTLDTNGTAPGTLTLTGLLSYTGQTTIGSMATMILSGTNASSIGALDVQAGGTFALMPNVSVTDLSGGGTISIGAGDTLTSTPTTSDTFTGTIIGAGALTLLGTMGTSLQLDGVNTYGGGTMVGSSATLIIGTSGSIVGALTDNGTFTMENSLSLTDLNGTNVNATININDNGTNPTMLSVSPTNLMNDSYFGVIQGSGGLTLGGNPGTSLTLLGIDTYTGGTTINAGATLNVAPSGSIVGAVTNNGTFGVENSLTITDLSGTGTGAQILISSGKTLSVAPTTNDTYAGIVGGSGALTIGTSIPVGTSGTSLTLSGKNTYTGGTTINHGGTLNVTGSIGGSVVVNGIFDVNNSFTIGDLTGTDVTAVIDLGAGDILTIDSTGTIASPDSFAGTVMGSGGITLATGVEDFTGNIEYTGITTIGTGATLIVNGTLAGPVINNGSLVDATSQTIGNLSGTGAITLESLNATPQTLTVIETGATTFGGSISGPGGFTLDSNGTAPGTLTLTGPLSYTGQTTIGSMATMILSGTNAFSIGALDVQAGGTFALLPNVSITDLTGAGTVSIGIGDTLTSTPTMNDTFSGTVIGAGAFSLQSTLGTGPSLTLTGANTYTGGTTIGTGATLIIGTGGSIIDAVTDNGTWTINNNLPGITDLTGSGTINLGSSGQTLTVTPTFGSSDVFSGAIITTTGGTSGGLTVSGASGGTGNSLTLTGDLSAYTGTTTIENNGTLNIEYADNLGSTAAVTFLGTGGGTLGFLGAGSQTLGNVTLGGTDTIDAGQAAAGTGASNIVTFNGKISSASAGNKAILQDGTFVIGTNADLSGFDHGTVEIGNGTLDNTNGTFAATLQFNTAAVPPPGTATATIEFNAGTVQYLGSNSIVAPAGINYVVDAAGGEMDNIGTAAGSITLDGTITDTTGGTLSFSGGKFILNANNSATLTSGTIAIGDAATIMQIDNQDAFGNSAVTVNDGSTLQTSNFAANSPTPGSSAGVLVGFNITAGAYMESTVSTSASILKLEMFGQPTNAAGYDKFQLGAGNATLNGTLDLGFLGGSVANPNINKPLDFDTYNIINTTGTVTDAGTFDNTITILNPYLKEKVTISGGQTAAYTSGWSSIVDPNAGDGTGADPGDGYDLRFWEKNTPNAGQQVIVQTLFSGYAQTPNELDVAKYLDNAGTPGNTTPKEQQILQTLSALGTNPGDTIGGVLNQFLPTDYAQLTQIGIQNSTFLNQQVFAQMANGFGGGTVNTNGLSIMQTSGESPDPFSMALNTQLQNTDQSVQQTASFMDNYNSWSVGEPVPSNSNQNPANSQAAPATDNSTPLIINSWSGFITGDVVISNTPSSSTSGGDQPDYMTGGILAGAGIQLDDDWSVGGYFNWGYTGASLDGVGSHQQGNSYTPGLFVGFQDNGWYADGLASYTYSSYRIDRNIQFSSMSSTATGQPTSSQYDLAVLGGYNAQVTDAFQMGPSAGVGYTHVDVSSFSETGSPFDMNVGAHSADSCRTLLGLAGQYTFAGKNAPLPIDINFNAYWQHEFLNNSSGISSSIGSVSSPATFIFNTNAPARDSVLGGIGVGGHINPNIALFANYELQAGANNLFGNTVFAGVAFSFK